MKPRTSPSTLSLAILGLIWLEPMSGYDLRKVFSTTPMGHFSTSPGAIYPALKRMEKAGFVKGATHKQDTLRPKRVYEITDQGRAALRQMLLRPVRDDEIIWHLDELILRFAFMGEVAGREQSLEFLKQLLPKIDAYIAHLRDQLGRERKRRHITGAYALEQGLAVYEATAGWARRVTREIRSKKPRRGK